jgi:hypothetical protein
MAVLDWPSGTTIILGEGPGFVWPMRAAMASVCCELHAVNSINQQILWCCVKKALLPLCVVCNLLLGSGSRGARSARSFGRGGLAFLNRAVAPGISDSRAF